MTCDEVLTARVLGRDLVGAAATHTAACARCRAEAPVAGRLARALAAHTVPPPRPDHLDRTLRAAAPLLAQNAARPAITRAVAATLLLLPLLVVLDAEVVRAAYAALSAFLPAALSAYVVGTYAALVATLVALSYAAVPLLAARQARSGGDPVHA